MFWCRLTQNTIWWENSSPTSQIISKSEAIGLLHAMGWQALKTYTSSPYRPIVTIVNSLNNSKLRMFGSGRQGQPVNLCTPSTTFEIGRYWHKLIRHPENSDKVWWSRFLVYFIFRLLLNYCQWLYVVVRRINNNNNSELAYTAWNKLPAVLRLNPSDII